MRLEEVGKTIDSNEPCFELRHDNGSWMSGCFVGKDEIYISAVDSKEKGSFKEMMDFIVKETGRTCIKFTMVVNDNLKSVLKGFMESQEWFEPCEEYVTCLTGVWENVHSRCL